MDIFYDTEFIERGRLMPIQLISIGLVADDGEFYGINAECLSSLMRDSWLTMNVAPHLPIHFDDPHIADWDKEHPEYDHVMNFDQLAAGVLKFLTERPHLRLWADYAAYDHVVLAQIFGTMAELPSGIPMWTHDLQQLIEGHVWQPGQQLPPEPKRNHHALEDARWCRDAHRVLTQSMSPAGRQAGVKTPVGYGEVIEDAVLVPSSDEDAPL